MGWWKLGGSEGFVMGDQPADVMGNVLNGVAAIKPSIDELLDAFEDSVRRMPSDMLADTLGARVIRVVDWPERRRGDVDAKLAEHLRTGLEAVSATYQKYIGRPAHIAELLEVMSFEFADDASPYLRDAERPFTSFALG